jgi:hypothetical protein
MPAQNESPGTTAPPAAPGTWLSRFATRAVVVLVAGLGAAKLADEFHRLVWRSGFAAANDLKYRHAEVLVWFSGQPLYELRPDASYPPATYVILWPLLGWLSVSAARWLWAVLSVAALAWLARTFVRESGASGVWQGTLAVLMLVSMNQTGVAVGNGQLILLMLPPLVAALLALHRARPTLSRDLAAAAGVTFALVKVTLTVPFLWLVLFAPSNEAGQRPVWWRWRPAILTALCYVALTLTAMAFQPGTPIEQLRAWLFVGNAAAVGGGDYGNVHAWLRALGLQRFNLVGSAVLFFGLGAWLHRNRDADLWLRVGVAALIARFWTYHRLYDDVLVALALVPLFRLAKPTLDAWTTRRTRATSTAESLRSESAMATALLFTCVVVMLLPARLGTTPRWEQIFNWSHAGTWLAMLAFLAWSARRAARPKSWMQAMNSSRALEGTDARH